MSELVKIESKDGAKEVYTSSTLAVGEEFKIKIYTAAQMVDILYEGQKVPLLWEEVLQLADIIKEIKNG
jgi:hypothetical protein